VQPPPILINVKASSTAIQTGESAVQLPGQQIKLFPTQTAQTPLPGGGAPKDTNTGSGGDPVQGTTGGPDNSLTLPVDPTFLGLTPGQYPPGGFTVNLNIDPTQTGLVGSGGALGANGTVNGVAPTSSFTIGGQTFFTYFVPNNVAQNLLGVPGIEINYCRTKEPLPPGKIVFAPVDPREAFPGATIHLGEGPLREARR
jgi:hypothetical protein